MTNPVTNLPAHIKQSERQRAENLAARIAEIEANPEHRMREHLPQFEKALANATANANGGSTTS